MKVHFETNRCIVRELDAKDEEGMFLLDSDQEVHKYLGDNMVQSREQAQEIIQYIQKQYRDNGMGRLAIIDRQTNEFVGWTGLKYEVGLRPGINYYDLGYRLRRPYWGKGLGFETAFESLRYGFETLRLKKICAGAHIDNIASNKILQKCGLLFREVFSLDDEDHNWYTIDAQQWNTQAKLYDFRPNRSV